MLRSRPSIFVLLLLAGCSPSVERSVVVAPLENLHRLADRLYSGGEPRAPDGFDALHELGIKWIISVDGMEPDVQAARARGMRYVHLPMGYGKIDREQAVRIVQAVAAADGPVYIHCHHGRHRGVAAAAIAAMAELGWSAEQALSWMRRAGASRQYAGLYASIEEFEPPGHQELELFGADLPESVPPAPMTEAMVRIDRHWDAVREADQQAAGSASLQLVEEFRELLRQPLEEQYGAQFVKLMRQAEAAAIELHRMGDDAARRAVRQSCITCHARFRE